MIGPLICCVGLWFQTSSVQSYLLNCFMYLIHSVSVTPRLQSKHLNKQKSDLWFAEWVYDGRPSQTLMIPLFFHILYLSSTFYIVPQYFCSFPQHICTFLENTLYFSWHFYTFQLRFEIFTSSCIFLIIFFDIWAHYSIILHISPANCIFIPQFVLFSHVFRFPSICCTFVHYCCIFLQPLKNFHHMLYFSLIFCILEYVCVFFLSIFALFPNIFELYLSIFHFSL